MTYHSSSFYDEESANSSTVTPIAGNISNRERDVQTLSLFPSRFTKALSILALAAFMVVGGISQFVTTLDPTVSKNVDYKYFDSVANKILQQQQHMMNVDLAAVLEASSSQIAFWDPYLDQPGESANEAVVENLMTITTQCFGRSIFRLQLDGTLQPIEQIQSSPQHFSQIIFTPNFSQDAMASYHGVAFVTLIHDPIDIYLDQYMKQGESFFYRDNLLVRHLSGIEHESRSVNDGDLYVAKKVLREKFIVGSCDDTNETLHRLVRMIATADSTTGRKRCTEEKQRLNEQCRRMKEIGRQNMKDKQQLLRDIRSDHHYDVLLYEESKKLFREQSALFE